MREKCEKNKEKFYFVLPNTSIMYILQVVDGVLPAARYGGTQRVVWTLGRELTRRGHRVAFLADAGSQCDFARVIVRNPALPLESQIPSDVDLVHLHRGTGVFTERFLDAVRCPTVTTVHGNVSGTIGENAVFVSRNHAERHGARAFVYNGLDWDDYASPAFDPHRRRSYFHFLAKAAWRVKNLRGALNIIRQLPDERLHVLGGTRLNFKMGFRWTLSPLFRVKFFGMVDQAQKCRQLADSKGLLFPVVWDEPFGLAMTESLWFGCPVFGTPYGSLPELIGPEVGFLSAEAAQLARAMKEWGAYSPQRCHEYARDLFDVGTMADRYLECYERVLGGQTLNPGRSEAHNTLARHPFH